MKPVMQTSSVWRLNHRNLWARKRMHLCMLDDQIGQKFTGLAPADIARLPHLINTKIVLVVNDLVHQLVLHLPTLNFLWGIVYFWPYILLLHSSKISMVETKGAQRNKIAQFQPKKPFKPWALLLTLWEVGSLVCHNFIDKLLLKGFNPNTNSIGPLEFGVYFEVRLTRIIFVGSF
jgi:hypothetical protein